MTAKFGWTLLAVLLLALRQPALHLTETVLTDLPAAIYGELQTSLATLAFSCTFE